jgi:hypothetical protein
MGWTCESIWRWKTFDLGLDNEMEVLDQSIILVLEDVPTRRSK